MKTIKIAFYRLTEAKAKQNRKVQSIMHYSAFGELLKKLAQQLDGDANKQVVDIGNNGLETSIWFDCFNETDFFKFQEYYYFLLAKDVPSIMKEDKKNKKLEHKDSQKDDIHLKIPAHFVFFPEKNILGVEIIEGNAPTKAVIEKAIKKYCQEQIHFEAVKRLDTLERLIAFQDAINSAEFDLKDFSHLVDSSKAGDFIDFLNDSKSKLKLKTHIDTAPKKQLAIDFFTKLLLGDTENEIVKYIKNMSVGYKNEREQQEIMELADNLLVFKKERELYYENLSNIPDEELKRKEYSKGVYLSIIEFYNEYFCAN